MRYKIKKKLKVFEATYTTLGLTSLKFGCKSLCPYSIEHKIPLKKNSNLSWHHAIVYNSNIPATIKLSISQIFKMAKTRYLLNTKDFYQNLYPCPLKSSNPIPNIFPRKTCIFISSLKKRPPFFDHAFFAQEWFVRRNCMRKRKWETTCLSSLKRSRPQFWVVVILFSG